MAYDAKHGYALLAGDNESPGSWTWNGTTWTKLSASPAANGHVMVYDSDRQRPVIFAGTTLEWDGAQWTQVNTPTSPPAMHDASAAYDPVHHQMVLYGGQYGFEWMGDTWTYSGVTWSLTARSTTPTQRAGHTAVYDPSAGTLLLFGGNAYSGLSSQFVNDTWKFNGSRWTLLAPSTSPSPRSGHTMAFDTARSSAVLFGGQDRLSFLVGLLADTWLWHAGQWSQASPAASPPPRTGHAMAYDGARARVVLFGGLSEAGATQLDDTWLWMAPPGAKRLRRRSRLRAGIPRWRTIERASAS